VRELILNPKVTKKVREAYRNYH